MFNKPLLLKKLFVLIILFTTVYIFSKVLNKHKPNAIIHQDNNKTKKNIIVKKKKRVEAYKDFVIKFNGFASKIVSVDNRYLLLSKTTNKKKIIDELNKIAQRFNSIDKRIKRYNKYLNNNMPNTALIPIKEYINFLRGIKPEYKVYFNSKMTQRDIEDEILKVSQSQYVDLDMIIKIAYIDHFKLFFNKNKKRFFKKGFTRNLKDYKKYMEYIELLSKRLKINQDDSKLKNREINCTNPSKI